MPKVETATVLAYGMREVGNGKWEAFRARVPLAAIEPISPVHRVALKESRWHDAQVPDPKQTDAEAPRTITRRVMGEVENGKYATVRGERMELALSRMQEAQRLEQVLKLPSRKKAS